LDYDRFNNSLTKLRDKKEKTLNDEKNLFKVSPFNLPLLYLYKISLRSSQLEQDFEIATNEYDYINNALKTDLPHFMVLATQFIDPLFHSFFYMQCVLLLSFISTQFRSSPGILLLTDDLID